MHKAEKPIYEIIKHGGGVECRDEALILSL